MAEYTFPFEVEPKAEGIHTHLGDHQMTVDVAGNVDGDWDERPTNKDSYVAYQKVSGGEQWLLIRRPDYEDWQEKRTIVNNMPTETISLKRKPLRRLVQLDQNRHRILDEDGKVFSGKGASSFLLFKKYLEGGETACKPTLDQLQVEGVVLIRIMGMFESLGGFNPKAYPDYYDKIVPFMNYVAGFGLYVLWTACAATGVWMTEDEAIDHIKKTVEKLLQTVNPLFSPVNEQGEHVNSINRQRFVDEVDMQWILHDTGSFGVDKRCEPPLGNFAVLHTTRSYPGEVKDGNIVDQPNHVQTGIECGIDEPYRMGDEGSGERHEDPKTASEAAGSSWTAIFWVAHSMQGERADVLTGNTLDCFRAAMDAMKGR